MAWRQLPDGSFFDPNTGDLRGLDGAKEAAAHAQSLRAGHIKPRNLPRVHAPTKFPPLPGNKYVVLPGIKGPQAIIDPKQKLLGVNPYELGFGGMGEMSTTTQRILVTGGIVAAVGAACWAMNKIPWLSGKKSK